VVGVVTEDQAARPDELAQEVQVDEDLVEAVAAVARTPA
jgi:hypothetical protein